MSKDIISEYQLDNFHIRDYLPKIGEKLKTSIHDISKRHPTVTNFLSGFIPVYSEKLFIRSYDKMVRNVEEITKTKIPFLIRVIRPIMIAGTVTARYGVMTASLMAGYFGSDLTVAYLNALLAYGATGSAYGYSIDLFKKEFPRIML